MPDRLETGDMVRTLARCWAWVLAACLMLGTDISLAQAGENQLKVQLVWGTDEAKPRNAEIKELEPKLRKKLERVFKWKNYFEIKQEQTALPSTESKRIKLSAKCEIEVRFVDEGTLEVKLFGEGKLTATKRQAFKPLMQGEILVMAGDDKQKFEDAWFVVVSVCAQPTD